MITFLHKLFNPHCPDCHNDKVENKVCQSCETLSKQLEIANFEKKQLLDKLLKEPDAIPTQLAPSVMVPPRTVPWKIRQQMLEREDRERARLVNQAPKPIHTSHTLETLEQELGVDDGENTQIANQDAINKN